MNPSRKRILVADCHEDVLIILEGLLEDAGFDTTTVWTAEEALKLVDSHSFDLVLVNEYLPDAGCEEVLNALRKRGVQTPCIVMQPSAPEIVDFTLSANTAFGRLSRLSGSVCCAVGSRSWLPACEMEELRKVFEGGSR